MSTGFGLRDELVRQQQAQLGVFPAHQRLHPRDGTTLAGDLGLVVQHELTGGHACAEALLHHQPLSHLGRHFGVVKRPAVAPCRLGPVHGHVGVAEQGLDVLIVDALRDKPHATHFGIPQALEAVDRVKPKRTYLTHVSHHLEYTQTNAGLPHGVELSYDGLRIAF